MLRQDDRQAAAAAIDTETMNDPEMNAHQTLDFATLRCASIIRDRVGSPEVTELGTAFGNVAVHIARVPGVLYVPALRLQIVDGRFVPDEAIFGSWALEFEVDRDFEGRGSAYRQPFEFEYCDREVCILSNFYSYNFHHWITEELVKVIILENYGFAGAYVLCDLPDFAIAFLHLLGVPDHRVIPTGSTPTMFKAAVYTSAISCENLIEYMPVYTALREALLAAAGEKPASAPRLWIHRGRDVHNPGRELVNREEVFGILRRYGFEIVDMAKLSVRTQIAMAHNARILSGPHGAGFVHSYFMRPKSFIVECFSPEFINSGILAICRMLDHKYSAVVHNNAYGAYPHGRRLYIDPLQLEVVLRGVTDPQG